jgi:nitroreductase
VTLVLVADLAKFADTPEATARMYAAFDAGCISQNVYLFAASEGLATVVHELNRAPLARALHLRDGQQIILAQAVGWPR